MRNTRTEKLVGYIGVDSGQMMLCDPCYIEDGFAVNDEAFPDEDDFEAMRDAGAPMNYHGACAQTLGPEKAGLLKNSYGVDLAAVCSSGYGDGVYPVYIEYNEDDRVVSMRIDFDEPVEDESDDLGW